MFLARRLNQWKFGLIGTWRTYRSNMVRYTRNRVRRSTSESWFKAFVPPVKRRRGTRRGEKKKKKKKKCGSGKLSECFAFARTAYRIQVKVWFFYQRWKRSNQVCSLVVNLRDANLREDLSATSIRHRTKKERFRCHHVERRSERFFSFSLFYNNLRRQPLSIGLMEPFGVPGVCSSIIHALGQRKNSRRLPVFTLIGQLLDTLVNGDRTNHRETRVGRN